MDSKELSTFSVLKSRLDDLMNLDVSMMTTMSYEPRPPQRRKNSDDDYYVEETLLFTYNPSKSEESPRKKAQTQAATQALT